MNVLLESAICLPTESDYRPLTRNMSGSGLTAEAQLRYLLQWFGEFSELQREDFLPVLAAAQRGVPDQLAATLAALSCQDKPVSLFQCRIKLFNEWYSTWTEEDRDRLVKGVTEVDEEFGKKLQELMANGLPLNGDGQEHCESFEEKVDESSQQNDNPPEEAEQVQALNQDNIPVEIAAAS